MKSHSSSDKPIPKMDLKFAQVFGEKVPVDKVSDEDIITSLEFDQTGQYIALGDKAGRLIIFEENEGKGKSVEYQYLTELQSHLREFDYLKSVEIEEKIIHIQWLRPQFKALYLVSTNDKTIKLWKVTEKGIKKPVKNAQHSLFPKFQTVETNHISHMQNSFPNLHTYNINAISVSPNEEYLISSDDLRVNLWSLHDTQTAYNVIDLKPDNLDELSEVITTCNYHPIQDTIFLYATSKGIMEICDLRKGGALNSNKCIHLTEKDDSTPKNFFTDIVSSVSSATFSKNGRYVVSRDFLNLKIWDVNMPGQPVSKVCIYEPLKTKLCELYENDCIFERFDVTPSPCSNYFVTGNFNNNFNLVDRNGETNTMYELSFNKKTINRQIPKKCTEQIGANYDYMRKVSKCAFHPKTSMAAFASLNCLFFYSC